MNHRHQTFYLCKHCGNLTGLIRSSGVPVHCCGEPMQELTANTTEAAQEKHLPVARVEGNRVHVCVGSVNHPMTEEHSIQWIYLQTRQGGQRKGLCPDQAPEADFALAEDEPVAAYAYCNLHGLWKTNL